jgi:ABC-type thiamine transport system substrate-binding protein
MEWEGTVPAAKKEGQVSVYVGDWAAVLDAGIFQRTYGIEIKGIDVGPTQASQRILAERRAGKYIVDVVFAGSQQMLDLYRAKALDPMKPVLLLPDVVDESKWWRGKHWYMDHESQYAFRFAYVPNVGAVSYNAKLVNPKEFKSLWDFLNPKWKGKIVAFDPRAGGSANAAMRFFYHHPDLGPRFIRRLFGEMDVTVYRDRRQGPDWLAVEKFAICFFCDTTEVARARRQGLPVAKFGPMKEGGMVTSRHGVIGLVNRAPCGKSLY